MVASASDVAFSPTVKSVQTRLGSRAQFEAAEIERPWPTTIRDDLAAFIASASALVRTPCTPGRSPPGIGNIRGAPPVAQTSLP